MNTNHIVRNHTNGRNLNSDILMVTSIVILYLKAACHLCPSLMSIFLQEAFNPGYKGPKNQVVSRVCPKVCRTIIFASLVLAAKLVKPQT